MDIETLPYKEVGIEEKALTEQDTAMRYRRAALLQASDIDVLRHLEAGEAVPLELREYRQLLRDLSTSPDLFNLDWGKQNTEEEAE
jgi:hypothetical protein